MQPAFGWINCAGGRCSAAQEALALASGPLMAIPGDGLVFKTGHYAQRLIAAGVDVASAEADVVGEINALESVVEGQLMEGQLTVDGVLLQYRAMPLPGGQISVGTIHPVW